MSGAFTTTDEEADLVEEYPPHLKEKAIRFGSSRAYHWKKSDLPEVLDWIGQNHLIIRAFELFQPLPEGGLLVLGYDHDVFLREFDHLTASKAAERALREFRHFLTSSWLDGEMLVSFVIYNPHEWPGVVRHDAQVRARRQAPGP